VSSQSVLWNKRVATIGKMGMLRKWSSAFGGASGKRLVAGARSAKMAN
jgi:hypothetical protein